MKIFQIITVPQSLKRLVMVIKWNPVPKIYALMLQLIGQRLSLLTAGLKAAGWSQSITLKKFVALEDPDVVNPLGEFLTQ